MDSGEDTAKSPQNRNNEFHSALLTLPSSPLPPPWTSPFCFSDDKKEQKPPSSPLVSDGSPPPCFWSPERSPAPPAVPPSSPQPPAEPPAPAPEEPSPPALPAPQQQVELRLVNYWGRRTRALNRYKQRRGHALAAHSLLFHFPPRRTIRACTSVSRTPGGTSPVSAVPNTRVRLWAFLRPAPCGRTYHGADVRRACLRQAAPDTTGRYKQREDQPTAFLVLFHIRA